ncbi:MAG TPA: c-type cytochrome biogenesis protein CcmI [Alphaproteobacteria bacterium]|nr:c-type cytochrome biogenesis protein CcmI [Alphaproteobacteria bacterium]
MIGFWIVAALMTAAVVVLLVWPLVRKATPADPAGADLAVYRDQLAELERDRARGLVEPAEAAALETEIGRRMLAAARSADNAPARTRAGRWMTGAIALAVPVGAILIYVAVGQPGLPAQPLAERQISPDADPAKILAAVEQVKSKLKPDKADLDRWVVVAEAYMKLGRPRDSVDAFRVAAGIDPNDPSLSVALAEALMAADGGAIGAEAKQRFQAVPDNSDAKPEARYYLALADAQAGDMKAALKGWQSLLADSPADAPWIEPTKARIAGAAQALGLDPVKETPQPRPASAKREPSAADIQAAEQMTPEQQQAMIRSMVGSLAAKLQANPDDAEGWRRLARAYQVLGDSDRAKDALARAAAAESKRPAP